MIVRLHLLLWLLFLSGCFYVGKDTYDDLVKQSPDTWSTRDCLTIVMAATKNNFTDQSCPNIKVAATVYSPKVIMANYRRAHILGRHHETSQLSLPELPSGESLESIADSQYISSLDILMQEETGLYYDWQTDRYVDSRGNYVRSYTQLDSLTFFIAIENKSWPCVPVLIMPQELQLPPTRIIIQIPMHTLTKLDYDPCYLPDISNLENEIYLVNDQNKFIRPLMVWGKQQNLLMATENLIVKFRVRKDDYHFLEHSDYMRLVIDGFDSKIMLDYPVAVLR